MSNNDLSLEAQKNKQIFENNRISCDLNKHNWLVEKLVQKKLIEELDNVAPIVKPQKRIGRLGKRQKSLSLPRPSSTVEKSLQPWNKINQNNDKSVKRCINLAKKICDRLAELQHITKYKQTEQPNTKKKQENKTKNKPVSVGTIDNKIFSDITLYKITNKDMSVFSTEDGTLNSEDNNFNNNKSFNNGGNSIEVFQAIEHDLCLALPLYTAKGKCSDNNHVLMKEEYPVLIENTNNSNKTVEDKNAEAVATTTKIKAYSIETQTKSVSIMTSEERDLLDLLKSKNLNKASLEKLLQESSKEPMSIINTQQNGEQCNNTVNDPAEVLHDFFKFYCKFYQIIIQLSQRLSLLVTSNTQNKSLEISNLNKTISKELENLTKESQNINQVLDVIFKSPIANPPVILRKERKSIHNASSGIRKEQDVSQHQRNFNHESFSNQQQTLICHSSNTNSINHQQTSNTGVHIQQPNINFQHKTPTTHQNVNDQPEPLNLSFGHLQSLPQNAAHLPHGIQQQNLHFQPQHPILSFPIYQVQLPPHSYEERWRQSTSQNQINQNQYRKQNIEQPAQRTPTTSDYRLPWPPVPASRQMPGQACIPMQATQYPMQPMFFQAHNVPNWTAPM